MEDGFEDFWKKRKLEDDARTNAQADLIASPKYQAELKFIGRVTYDIIHVLRQCFIYSSRGGEIYDNSLVIRSTDDLVQSIVAAWTLVHEGMINPIKRELRYIIEASIKYLYVDQQFSRYPIVPLNERLDFLQKSVDRSNIDIRDQLVLEALHPDDSKQLIDELYDIYRTCCAYVHVSPSQIKERLALAEKGRSIGFETEEELRKIGRLMFRTYDIALTLYFQGFGLSMTGDIFIETLDHLPDWKFHKGKYVAVVSGYFDYKHERNMRKYGQMRPWNPKGWPPKRL